MAVVRYCIADDSIFFLYLSFHHQGLMDDGGLEKRGAGGHCDSISIYGDQYGEQIHPMYRKHRSLCLVGHRTHSNIGFEVP